MVVVKYSDVREIIQVFPNPSNGLVNLHLDNPFNKALYIKVFNNVGRKIWESEVIEGETNWKKEMQIQGNGIYFVITEVGGEIICKRLILMSNKTR